jgi:hypothetical protein
MIGKESGFIDQETMEYHWLWASNNSTTLDKECVVDLRRWRWFDIDRDTGKRLQCGTSVSDTNGNCYAYGVLDTGFVERLENGTDFDGNDITCTMQVGEQVPIPQDLLSMTRILRANLICIAKNTDSSATITHYLDGKSTGADYTFSMADAIHRYANDIEDIYSTPAIFHSFKLVATSGTETKGFEPLYLSVYYQKERDHTS